MINNDKTIIIVSLFKSYCENNHKRKNMGDTTAYLRTRSQVVDRGIDIRSYATVSDSDNDVALKVAVAGVVGQASEHIAVRHAHNLKQPYAWGKQW